MRTTRAAAGAVLAACAAAIGFSASAAGAPASSGSIIIFHGTPPPVKHAKRPDQDAAALADLKLPALVGQEPARVSAAKPLAAGDSFLELGVRHGVTGTLAADVAAKGWLGPARKLPAGSTVFGVTMGGPDGRALVWCAPQNRKAKDKPDHWITVCLPYGDASNLWVEGAPAMMPTRLDWVEGGRRPVDAPEVRREPAVLPPMTLSYAFAGWDAKGWLKLEIRLDWGEGAQALRAIALAPGDGGAVTVKALGGEVALRRDPADAARAVLEVKTPPRPEAPIEF